jgi:long-chain fatty acid transport protein
MSYHGFRRLTAIRSPGEQRFRRAIGLAGIILLAARAGGAQTNAEVNAGIQFDFSTPGARSLGGGGAFVARADDSTAAYANPAGLTILSDMEVSAEVRNWSFTHQFTEGGRLSGTPTGNGVDNEAGIRQGTANSHEIGLSYYSFVFPSQHFGRKWTLAVYRHEVGDFRANFQTQGAILNDATRINPTRNHLDLKIVDLGLATAVKFGSLSLGAGITRSSFSLFSVTQRFATLAGPGYPPPTYDPADIENSQVQQGDNSQVAFNLGVIWRPSNSRWNIGATYRQGPRFTFSALTEPGPAGSPSFAAARKAKFAVPDVFGLGASFQPGDWTLSLEYDRVRYSALTSSFINIFPGAVSDLASYRVNDSNQVHLGSEYLMFNLNSSTLKVFGRLGAWYDPDHKIRYDGPDSTSRALFTAGSNEAHVSVGLGLNRLRERKPLAGLDWLFAKFELDAAFDYSRQVRTASLSSIVYF